MMLATEKMRSGSGSSDPEKTGRPTKSGYGRKTLESGHRFMPNVSTRRLTGAIEGEKDPTARFRLLACRFRENGYSIRKICRGLGMPYSTVRDWLVRMSKRGLKGRFNRRRMEARTAQNKTGRTAYVPAEQAELCNRLPLGKAAY